MRCRRSRSSAGLTRVADAVGRAGRVAVAPGAPRHAPRRAAPSRPDFGSFRVTGIYAATGARPGSGGHRLTTRWKKAANKKMAAPWDGHLRQRPTRRVKTDRVA